MSQENQKTLEVYAERYDQYAANEVAHKQKNPEKAAIKRAKLETFIRNSFAPLGPGAKIIEIGAAMGEDARYLASLGYDVTATDAVNGFLSEIAKDGIKTEVFDILEDEFPCSVDGIFCWRVFVHFTILDFKIALQKCYDAMRPGGRLVFNVMNHGAKTANSEWVDFPNEYHMGADRFYQYYDSNEVFKLLSRIGFRTVNYFQQGGDSGNKWLVFVVES